jgi:hypothetical protein
MEQAKDMLEFLQTGSDPNIRKAGEAGYQQGYLQGAADRQPGLQIDVLTRIRRR